MGIFDFFNQVVDWAAEQVQISTGEKERREVVQRIKEFALEFREKVSEAVLYLNQTIKYFNQSIQVLNIERSNKVKSNLNCLQHFLEKFGSCKPYGTYAAEEMKLPEQFPQYEYELIENYITDIDWSKDDVFINTFFRSPLGMKIVTQKQNLSMTEQLHELQIQMENTLQELSIKKLITEQEIKICSLYIKNIQFISNFITKKILPELELIEAFFEANNIKNEVICDHCIDNLKFIYDIQSIQGTIYQKHYQFIKNTFAFYVISSRIYNTPILTNLLNNSTNKEDVIGLENEYKILTSQAEMVNGAIMAPRKGEN